VLSQVKTTRIEGAGRSCGGLGGVAHRPGGVKLSLGGSIYDPADPMSKMFFNMLAVFAEFEVDLLRMRTREGMAVAKAKGKLRGKQPKLSARQQAELRRMHDGGGYTIADLAEVFSVSRPTVYRVLDRAKRQETSTQSP
jgi:DNA invertase Pin-like site-specific DNA recombinase